MIIFLRVLKNCWTGFILNGFNWILIKWLQKINWSINEYEIWDTDGKNVMNLLVKKKKEHEFLNSLDKKKTY